MRRFSLRELSITPCLLAAGMALAGTLDLQYGRGETRSLAVNGTELTYLDKGAGPPILLVHGALRDYRHWQSFIAEAAKSHRVVAYSLRGYFPNSPAAAAEPSDAADLIALIEKLDLAPVHLVGHSLGGTIALEVASQRPELLRSLTLEEGGIVADGVATQAGNAEMMAMIQQAIGDLQRGNSAAAARAFTDQVIGPGAYERATPAERQLSLDNVKTLSSGRPPHPLTCDVMKRIAVPTLFLTGENTVPRISRSVKEVTACLSNETIVSIPRATHDVHTSNPEAFNNAVLAFISP